MTFISASVVNILYNMQLMKWSGEPGVAAYGVIMYYLTVAEALFIGYSIGAAPVISYNYGSEDKVLERGAYEDARSYFPKNAYEVIIEGGNHAGFGNYGKQNGDGTAAISSEEQQEKTVEEILKLLENAL